MRVWGKNSQSPGLAMSRSIGDDLATSLGVSSTPDVGYQVLTENDRYIVMGSDGIWEWLSNEQVMQVVVSTL